MSNLLSSQIEHLANILGDKPRLAGLFIALGIVRFPINMIPVMLSS